MEDQTTIYLEGAKTSFDIALDSQEWDCAKRIMEELQMLGYSNEVKKLAPDFIKAKIEAKEYRK